MVSRLYGYLEPFWFHKLIWFRKPIGFENFFVCELLGLANFLGLANYLFPRTACFREILWFRETRGSTNFLFFSDFLVLKLSHFVESFYGFCKVLDSVNFFFFPNFFKAASENFLVLQNFMVSWTFWFHNILKGSFRDLNFMVSRLEIYGFMNLWFCKVQYEPRYWFCDSFHLFFFCTCDLL